MSSKRLILVLFVVLFILLRAHGINIYRWPLGDLKIAFPAQKNELNLYHYSGNSAWLQASDSLNWMTVAFNRMLIKRLN